LASPARRWGEWVDNDAGELVEHKINRQVYVASASHQAAKRPASASLTAALQTMRNQSSKLGLLVTIAFG